MFAARCLLSCLATVACNWSSDVSKQGLYYLGTCTDGGSCRAFPHLKHIYIIKKNNSAAVSTVGGNITSSSLRAVAHVVKRNKKLGNNELVINVRTTAVLTARVAVNFRT